MEVAGLKSSSPAFKQKETPNIKKAQNFHQVLKKAASGKDSKRADDQSTPTNNDSKAAEDLLSFLNSNAVQQVDGVSDGAAQDSKQNLLKTIKNLLGISDEKWSKILSELQKNSDNKKDNGMDEMEMFIAGFSGLHVNQLLSSANENEILFLKAAKLYNLLSEQNTPNQQYLTGLLNSVQGKLEMLLQNNKNNPKLQYLQSSFSQVVKDVTNKTASEENNANPVSRLEGYSETQPLFQQMSKPEQLSVMLGGTQKPVSVNDLISQFESILAKSQFSKTGGVQKLLINLYPENLGSLRIELIQKGEAIAARIITTTDAAKNTLESHLHSLKHAFEVQNIKVDNIEIEQQQSGANQERFNRDQQNQQQDPQEQNQGQVHKDEADSDFTLTLEEAITNQEE